ncbi:hypothetical protein [Bacillus cereus]|uniref:hypothetical protein n=1 Tax=Bacillus cereus TaxID=1396 RepID=UPI000995B466|nr:hypothetical protein [Bacillus cereus]OOZ91568.1 hypothetical protein BHL25_01055 [Bacillus cereus]
MLSIDDIKKALEFGQEIDFTQARYTEAGLKYNKTVNTFNNFSSEKFNTVNREGLIEVIKKTSCPTTKIMKLETLHFKMCTYNDNFKNDECRSLLREFNETVNDILDFLPEKKGDFTGENEKGISKYLKFLR